MRCEEVTGHLADYLAGEADHSVRSSIESHLASCFRCRSELQSLGSLWERLGALPNAELRPGVRVRFQAVLDAYEAGLELSGRQSPIHRGSAEWLRNYLRPALVYQFALAAVFLVIGALAGHFLPFGKRGTEEMAQLREEIHSMRQLVTVSLLQQDSASERLAGVNWSQRVRQPDEKVLDALIGALNHDTSIDVRLAAVDALYRFSDRPVVRQELVQSLLRQNSPLVQIALIDLMVELREKGSAEVLRQLATDEKANPTVRDRAKWGLQQLS